MKPNLKILKIVSHLFFSIIFISKIYAQPGALDNNFGVGGKVTTFDSGYNLSLASAIQTDGKIILGGFANKDGSNPRFALIRYLINGAIDSSFGSYGKSILDSIGNSLVESIVLQPDGKILAGGFNYYPFNFAIARFLSNGKLDSTFGTNGLTSISFGNELTSLGYSLALQSNGKILLTGNLNLGQNGNIGTIRFNSNGKLDSTFGIDGKIQTVENDFSGLSDIVLLSNGKILISTSENGITFLQYNQNGTPDITFGNNGKVQTHISTYGGSMIIQNNKILVIGDTSVANKNEMMIVRFNLNGLIDSSFGTYGKATVSFNGYTYTNSVATQSNGDIIVSGTETFDTTSSFFAMARFKKNGIIDNSFGISGKVSTAFNEVLSESHSVVIQKNDKIILSGYTANKLSGNNVIAKFALARYNNDAVLPVSLLSFTATKQQQSVLLNWQTANEINNSYFWVEKSNNNKVFTEINKVSGKGNSSKTQSYNATDLKPFQGWNYYRLKQVDKDGKFNYSSIASVYFDDGLIIAIYPNPANNLIYVDGLKEDTQTNISITDINGKTVLTATNQSSHKINIQNLASGVYYINIFLNGKSFKQKFVKQ